MLFDEVGVITPWEALFGDGQDRLSHKVASSHFASDDAHCFIKFRNAIQAIGVFSWEYKFKVYNKT